MLITRPAARAFFLMTARLLALLIVAVFLGCLLACFWWRYSEDVSDAAVAKMRHGMPRWQVERVLQGWTPETLATEQSRTEQERKSEYNQWLSKNHPGYSIVRYTKWADIYVDIHYDGRGRVFQSNCNN